MNQIYLLVKHALWVQAYFAQLNSHPPQCFQSIS